MAPIMELPSEVTALLKDEADKVGKLMEAKDPMKETKTVAWSKGMKQNHERSIDREIPLKGTSWSQRERRARRKTISEKKE
ncbi:hypothetical protein K0M31_001360 [Melipona bicolor]|uniref:Uncharacterized protein n=1 Tax=Melipona bicolor TaxID=60889 RepID=A0AA40GG79_9HYME|nr:hypothetical protein K0M31_001360 [Melipona bicolor]